MPKQKEVPRWFVERVKDINLRLIDELNMSWDEVLDFWEEIIKECRQENEDTK
tara:strand:- start:29389 stop:29547 length:159 start_codon:yes stop_codon:yes gene_type:complete